MVDDLGNWSSLEILRGKRGHLLSSTMTRILRVITKSPYFKDLNGRCLGEGGRFESYGINRIMTGPSDL